MTTQQGAMSLKIHEGVAHIVLSRPEKMNALSRAFWTDFPKLIDEISQSASARCIVISSTGKHFTAGMDLDAFSSLSVSGDNDPHLSSEAFLYEVARLQDAFSALERARMPVIAAVQGGCIGAGVDMISACDIRLCTKDAWFCIHEINIAMTADVGTFPRLAKIMPEGWVRQMAYTGERLPADKAMFTGLVNEVYEDQDAMVEAAHALAKQIASKDPLSITGTKEMLNYARDHTTEDALRYVGVWNAAMLSPARLQESIRAQAEKRVADYPDLLSVTKKTTE